jgi:hypothetical protein
MLRLTSVSASEGDVADECMPSCQRVHAMTVTVYMATGYRTWIAGSQANRLDHSATTHRKNTILYKKYKYNLDTFDQRSVHMLLV